MGEHKTCEACGTYLRSDGLCPSCERGKIAILNEHFEKLGMNIYIERLREIARHLYLYSFDTNHPPDCPTCKEFEESEDLLDEIEGALPTH